MGIHQNLLASSGPRGEALFNVPGTFSWVAPSGVTKVSAVCVGGGGGANGWGDGAQGGGGGGLGWKNSIAVTPGQSYTVQVGSGGTPSSDLGGNNNNSSSAIAYNPNGSAGLTNIYNGNIDDTFFTINLPFTIGFRGLPWTTVYVGSNGYITFTAGSYAYSSLNAANPPGGYIGIFPGDRRTYNLWTGHQNIGTPSERFVIRQEGVNFSDSGVPNAWEVHFYPNQVYFDVLFVTVPSNNSGTINTAGVSDGTSWILTYATDVSTLVSGTAQRSTTVSTLPDAAGGAGGNSYFISLATVAGLGGQSAPPGALSPVAGGSYVGDGGGNGGSSSVSLSGIFNSQGASGGGGAGGYTGNGGNGGVGGVFVSNGSAGAGGGGGGGGGATTAANSGGGGGGGTGLQGQGANGSGGGTGTYIGGGGTAGSSGTVGASGSAVGQDGGPAGRVNQGGNGGTYGGGAGCSRVSGSGGSGGVRLIWGEGRSFPNNAV